MSVEELDSHTGHTARDLGGVPARVVALDDPDPSEPHGDPTVRPLGGRLAAAWGRVSARRVVASVGAVALLAGVVLGTAATDGRRDRQSAAVRDAEVLLVAAPGATSGQVDDVRDSGLIRMTGSLQVLNMGRATLTVTGLRAEARGLTTEALTDEREIAPGSSGVLLLRAVVDCATFVGAEPVRYVASVRTADGQERETPLDLLYPANGITTFDQNVCNRNTDVSLSARYRAMEGPDADGSVAFRFDVTSEDPEEGPLDVVTVSLGWADSARIDAPGGTQRIPPEGARLTIRVDVEACPIVAGQGLDGGFALQTVSADGLRAGDAYVTVGARYQADVLAFLTEVCGPELAGRPPGPP